MSAVLPSPRDRALLAATPVEPVLPDASLRDLAPGQRRLVCAAGGLYAEARSSALHVRSLIGAAMTPYGPADAFIRPSAGPVPVRLVAQFVAAAQASPECEIAGVIEIAEQGYALRLLGPISAGAGHVSYHDDVDDERLVIDLHSHGRLASYFSSQDDRSDLSRRGPYLAMVVGLCGTAQPSISARIVMPPYLLPTSVSDLTAEGVLSCA